MRKEIAFGQKKWAVVGDFNDVNSRAYKIYTMLKDAGFIVYAAGSDDAPNGEGYENITKLPEAVDIISVAGQTAGCSIEKDFWYDESLKQKLSDTVFWVEPFAGEENIHGFLSENGMKRVFKGLSVLEEYPRVDQVIEGYIEKIVEWLQYKVQEAHCSGLIVGISGGVDSAVVASLAKRAFGEKCTSLILPCHSSEADTAHGIEVAKTIGIDYKVVDLTAEHDGIMKSLDFVNDKKAVLNKEKALRAADSNLRARLRMSTIYAYGNYHNYLVLGTDNAAEVHIGYYTKYGDGGVDLLPIAQLLKCEVFHMARKLGVPKSVLYKAPSAGLWEGQTDEKEIGVSYDVIDTYLAHLAGEVGDNSGVGGEQPKALEGTSYPKVTDEAKKRIDFLHAVSEHKRHIPPHAELK